MKNQTFKLCLLSSSNKYFLFQPNLNFHVINVAKHLLACATLRLTSVYTSTVFVTENFPTFVKVWFLDICHFAVFYCRQTYRGSMRAYRRDDWIKSIIKIENKGVFKKAYLAISMFNLWYSLPKFRCQRQQITKLYIWKPYYRMWPRL